MRTDKLSIIMPVLVLTLGVGWLLTTMGVLPEVNWVWVLGLGVAGLATLASGIDRLSFVVGFFLLSATMLSLLRQTGRISLDMEVPVLVIVLGVLMLLARLLPLPRPKWLDEPPPRRPGLG